MNRLRTVGVPIAAVLAFLVSVAMPSASAHTHPAPPDLTAPGVVYVESGYHVQITVVEHGGGVHIRFISREFDPVLNRGSGFVVDPSAVIVTSAAVTAPDERAAKNYAINSAFKNIYGTRDPTLTLPSDPLTQQSFARTVGVPGDYSRPARLKACYGGDTNSAGGCVITLTQFIKVHPYVTDQTKYGNLDAKVLTTTASGISVLRVSAGSMPTVKLVDITSSTYHLWVFGFRGVPGANTPFDAFKAHLNKDGGNAFKDPTGDNAPFKLVTATVLSSGLQGGPVVIAEPLGAVCGMVSATPAPAGGPGAGGPSLVGMPAIRAALARAGVTPTRGLADLPYESAMHKFNNKGYAASIPDFRAALAAYPGHYLAAKDLKTAEAQVKSGSPVSVPPTSAPATSLASTGGSHTRGLAGWVWLVIGIGVLLAVGVVWWLIARRRRPPATPPSRPGPPAPAGSPRSQPPP
ncbi:MAG: hypothetical protein ACRDVG_03775, partial [Jatrophihabitantaceae bacterium]